MSDTKCICSEAFGIGPLACPAKVHTREAQPTEPLAPPSESSADLQCLVDDIRAEVAAKGRLDWVDGKNLLRVIDAMVRERQAAASQRERALEKEYFKRGREWEIAEFRRHLVNHTKELVLGQCWWCRESQAWLIALAHPERKEADEIVEAICARIEHQRDALKLNGHSAIEGLGWADLSELVDNIRSQFKGKFTLAGKEADELRLAARALLKKLDRVEEDTKGIFVMAHIHGQNYAGANWSEEYKALEAAL
jgi:hypothetical protein